MRPLASTRGFTLLEVLIALFVFSIGLLGLAGLMVVSVKTNNSAYLRTQATYLAQSLADHMRANTGVIDSYEGAYSASTAGADPCLGVACDPTQLVARDKAIWSQQMVDSLPNPTANLACDGGTLGTPATSGAATYDGLCTLTMTWTESKLANTNSPTADTQTFAWVFQP